MTVCIILGGTFIFKAFLLTYRLFSRLVLVDDDDEDFNSSFEESFSVYKKYQMVVHGDPVPSGCNPS